MKISKIVLPVRVPIVILIQLVLQVLNVKSKIVNAHPILNAIKMKVFVCLEGNRAVGNMITALMVDSAILSLENV